MRVIYEPRGKAREYAPLAVNLYTGGWNGGGCNNGCKYCYVQWMPGFRDRRGQPLCLRDGVLEQLEKDVEELAARGCQDEILLSFTHDPFLPSDTSIQTEQGFVPMPPIMLHPVQRALDILVETGLKWTTLTKNPYIALTAGEDFYRKAGARCRFGVSLSWVAEATEEARWWEPNADIPALRINCLGQAKDYLGLRTWVSLEPVLDPVQAIELICSYSDIVDEWRIGLANYVEKWPAEAQEQYWGYWRGFWLRVRQPWHGFDWAVAAKEFGEWLANTLQKHARAWYVKHSLRPYMPKGFPYEMGDVSHASKSNVSRGN